MIRSSSKTGLVWTAIVALVGSLFGALPASATNATANANIALVASGDSSTNLTGTVYEDFPLSALLIPGQTNANFATDKVKFKVEATGGVGVGGLDVIISTFSPALIQGATTPASLSPLAAGNEPSISAVISAGSGTYTATNLNGSVSDNRAQINFLAYSTSPLTSSSPQVTLVVTVWIDEFGGQNGELDDVEWRTTRTVTLVNANAIAATTAVSAMSKGDSAITVSSTVTGLNLANLGGTFYHAVSSSPTAFQNAGVMSQYTYSAGITSATADDRAGVVSVSFAVSSGNGATQSTVIGAQLRYVPTASWTTDAEDNGYAVGSLTNVTVSDPGADSITVAIVPDAANVSGSNVRPNTLVTMKFTTTTNSATASNQAFSVKLSGTALSDGSNAKMISVNGGALTTSYPTALAVTSNADGFAYVTIETAGFEDSDYVVVNGFKGNTTGSATIVTDALEYTLTNVYDTVTTQPGTAVTLNYNIKDQFNVASAETGYRVAVTRGGTGFSYATTVSYLTVVAGKASFDFTPTPSTATGSATVAAKLQKWNGSIGAWQDASPSTTDTATINVTSVADSFETGPATSYSASVSYWPSTVSWVQVTGAVANTGSSIIASATGLKFQNADGDTSSDTITVRAGTAGAFAFSVSGELTGTYTLTITNGAASTTSLIIIDVAAHDSGKSIAFDTTEIKPGTTRIVTGQVLDMNGNGVATAGTASIAVSFAGTAGILVGSLPTTTDADGKFVLSVLTSANDSGSFLVTAVYNKDGAATATSQKVTATQVITVGASASAADQKITVGTFKGYVAIYTKGYMGQKLSAKVAGKWLVVDPIAAYKSNDYSRTVRLTGAGYTITVDLYIDGAFVRSEVVTTK